MQDWFPCLSDGLDLCWVVGCLDKAGAFYVVLEFWRMRTVGLILSSAVLLGLIFILWGYWTLKMRR